MRKKNQWQIKNIETNKNSFFLVEPRNFKRPKLQFKNFIQGSLVILISVLIIFSVVKAGTITPPGGTPTAQFYTLSEIYEFITNNTTATAASHDFTFSDGLAGTSHTLNEIYNELAGLISADQVKSGTTYLGVEGTLKSLLPDTNQTLCYDDIALSACPVSGFPGQDADYIASNSATCTPSYTQGTYTVTDNCTNLEWQRYGHGSSDGYNVPAAVEDCFAGGTYSSSYCTYSWQDALKYCDGLTLNSQSDWRLPNARDLWSIIDHSRFSPAIDITKFSSTASGLYWSSTTTACRSSNAGAVDFDVGGMDAGSSKFSSTYVRCVRP